jgi:hypothetical protein
MDAKDVLNEFRGFVAEGLWRRMIRYHGKLRSSRVLPARLKQSFAGRYHFEERSQIALAAASMYPGGDYFEFGSEGFHTFRNFLTAFDLNGLTTKLPDVKFWAFDAFGEIEAGRGVPADDAWYFEQYRGQAKYRLADRHLRKHGLLLDRYEIVKGYFEDTLDEQLKARLRRERRRIGFAFIDCNITSSYRTVFQFLPEFMNAGRCLVYMDEYFLVPDVPPMFEAFSSEMTRLHNARPYYVRNAGTFGALFCFMHNTGG